MNNLRFTWDQGVCYCNEQKVGWIRADGQGVITNVVICYPATSYKLDFTPTIDQAKESVEKMVAHWYISAKALIHNIDE